MRKFYMAMRFVGGSGINYYGSVVHDGRLTDPAKIAADLAKKQQQRLEESHTLPLAAELVEWAVVSEDGDLVETSQGACSVQQLSNWVSAAIGDHGLGQFALYGFGGAKLLRLAWLHAARVMATSPWPLADACVGHGSCGSGEHMRYIDPYTASVGGQAGSISLPALLRYCDEDVADADVAAWDVVTEAKMVKFLADKLGL